MEKGQKNSVGLKVLIIILTIALLGLSGYIVYDKVIKKDEVKEPIVNEENKPSNEIERKEINIKFDENHMLYVNDNKVDFYNESDYKLYITNESEFYYRNNEFIEYEYEVIDDVVFVKTVVPFVLYGEEYYFIDATGKIIKKIGGTNSDIEFSVNSLIQKTELKESNSIYFTINNSDIAFNSECAICDRLSKGEQNEIAVYVDRITYLGNGEFKLDKAVETMTYDEYADSQPGFDRNYCHTC